MTYCLAGSGLSFLIRWKLCVVKVSWKLELVSVGAIVPCYVTEEVQCVFIRTN